MQRMEPEDLLAPRLPRKDKPRRFFSLLTRGTSANTHRHPASHAGQIYRPSQRNLPFDLRKAVAGNCFQIVRVAFKAKSAILISCVFLVETPCRKISAVGTGTFGNTITYRSRRQAYRLHQLAHTFHEASGRWEEKARRRPKEADFDKRPRRLRSPTNGSIPAGS